MKSILLLGVILAFTSCGKSKKSKEVEEVPEEVSVEAFVPEVTESAEEAVESFVPEATESAEEETSPQLSEEPKAFARPYGYTLENDTGYPIKVNGSEVIPVGGCYSLEEGKYSVDISTIVDGEEFHTYDHEIFPKTSYLVKRSYFSFISWNLRLSKTTRTCIRVRDRRQN